MKLTLFSAKSYDTHYFNQTLQSLHPDLTTITAHPFALTASTVSLARSSDAICVFVNDTLDATVLHALHSYGVRAILLRCAGFNNIDLPVAEALGFFVANVPSYSPEAVAEFAVALIQTLNRKTHRAYNRVREGNFNLEGFLGQTLAGKTVGVVGLGRIGMAFARIMKGFGCVLLGADPFGGEEFEKEIGGSYVGLEDLLAQSDVVSLHCPLTEGTRHLINAESLSKLKKGAMVVNTSRGGLIHTRDAVQALKDGRLGGLALDVYEEEGDLFYNDHSAEIIHDDTLMRLMTFPNVLVCGHQAFFTREALSEIAQVSLDNLEDWAKKRSFVSTAQQAQRQPPQFTLINILANLAVIIKLNKFFRKKYLRHVSAGDKRFILKYIHAVNFEDLQDINNRLRNNASHVRLPQDIIPDKSMFVFEYFTGHLLHLAQQDLSLQTRKRLLKEGLRAIAEMHDKDIVHTDIKPDNFFVNWKHSDDGNTIGKVQLGDLEDAVYMPPGSYMLGKQAGNWMWRSPEAHARGQVNKPSDIFSFALVCIYVVHKRVIFAVSDDELDEGIDRLAIVIERQISYFADKDGFHGFLECLDDNPWADVFNITLNGFNQENPVRPFLLWKGVDDDFKSLICAMTNFDPRRRLTAREALAHKWFDDA
ncbi:2-hydroxyacid dehydrogenase homolog [Aspergillus awamori]|uniref:2-hydroxyacid dehydrogenase homolog n=1 Tax=Aspergillus awamori TaxID=105351 RepID=A0A401L4A0_ASPAW|nr:2-hydroxyacid dehydrogenase homolog [Aspergillus awamori]